MNTFLANVIKNVAKHRNTFQTLVFDIKDHRVIATASNLKGEELDKFINENLEEGYFPSDEVFKQHGLILYYLEDLSRFTRYWQVNCTDLFDMEDLDRIEINEVEERNVELNKMLDSSGTEYLVKASLRTCNQDQMEAFEYALENFFNVLRKDDCDDFDPMTITLQDYHKQISAKLLSAFSEVFLYTSDIEVFESCDNGRAVIPYQFKNLAIINHLKDILTRGAFNSLEEYENRFRYAETHSLNASDYEYIKKHYLEIEVNSVKQFSDYVTRYRFEYSEDKSGYVCYYSTKTGWSSYSPEQLDCYLVCNHNEFNKFIDSLRGEVHSIFVKSKK
jgi:hypothetical protein